MNLFDPKFLYCNPEDFLEGKEVFIGNSREYLIDDVNSDTLREKRLCMLSESQDFPFKAKYDLSTYRYVYYDPLYDIKRAFAEGKTVEYQPKNHVSDIWYVSTEGVVDPEHYFYRIKEEEPKVINEQTLEEKWKEFQEAGLLHFVNEFLHIFGYSIIIEKDEDDNGKVLNVYPKKVNFTGFSEKSNEEAYIKIADFMKNNADRILKEKTND